MEVLTTLPRTADTPTTSTPGVMSPSTSPVGWSLSPVPELRLISFGRRIEQMAKHTRRSYLVHRQHLQETNLRGQADHCTSRLLALGTLAMIVSSHQGENKTLTGITIYPQFFCVTHLALAGKMSVLCVELFACV